MLFYGLLRKLSLAIVKNLSWRFDMCEQILSLGEKFLSKDGLLRITVPTVVHNPRKGGKNLRETTQNCNTVIHE